MKASSKVSVRSVTARLALFAAALLATPALAAAQTETVRLAGASVAVFNLAGHATVTAGSGSDVVVTVRRVGPDAGRLEVASGVIELGRGDFGTVETLRILYPEDRIRFDDGYGRSELRVRDDGTFWGRRDGRDTRRVEVGSRVDGMEASADLEIAVPRGKRVLVALAVGTIEARNVEGDLYLDTGSGSIATAQTRGVLNLDTGSGNVTVDGADGSLSVDTGSGSVEVRSVRGPEVSIDTGSGSVDVTDVDAPDIEVDTGSGNVRVVGARTGRVGVDTGSGDVTIETVAGSASMSVDTGSGSVTVAVPADYAGDIQLETSSGQLRTDLPITLIRKDDDEIIGRIGEGGTARIEIDTASGNISIRRS